MNEMLLMFRDVNVEFTHSASLKKSQIGELSHGLSEECIKQEINEENVKALLMLSVKSDEFIFSPSEIARYPSDLMELYGKQENDKQ